MKNIIYSFFALSSCIIFPMTHEKEVILNKRPNKIKENELIAYVTYYNPRNRTEMNQHLKEIALLIQKNPQLIHAKDALGRNALMRLFSNVKNVFFTFKIPLIELLIRAGINPNDVDQDNNTVLHHVIKQYINAHDSEDKLIQFILCMDMNKNKHMLATNRY